MTGSSDVPGSFQLTRTSF